jgi:hypothetical protein
MNTASWAFCILRLGMLVIAGTCFANPALATVGATVPFTEYEAEAGTLDGGAKVVSLTSPPLTQYSSPELEASGHAYVALTGTDQSVSWKNDTDTGFTAMDARICIPDSPEGGGITTTLDLYVDGTFRQAINLSSAQTWLYENPSNYNGNDKNPSHGHPRVFFDEARLMISGAPVAPGSTIMLKQDAANTATFYYIDVVDLEAPVALDRAANSLSIIDFGAVADKSDVDSTGAIQKCMEAAESHGKGVWIPAGTFYMNGTSELRAKGITIQGAGMWFSIIHRNVPVPNSVPLGPFMTLSSCTVKDLTLDASAKSRASAEGDGGGIDISGENWLIDGIWVLHASSGLWAAGSNGTVQNCRMTSCWGDGINLNNVSNGATAGTNLTAQNNFIRGTGDDALAINSVNYNDYDGKIIKYTLMSHITMANNTTVAPWGGKGIGIYGGINQVVRDNLLRDSVRYVGLGVGKFGVNGSYLLSAVVTGNTILRCGGNGYLQKQGALFMGTREDGQGAGLVQNAFIGSNTIKDSLYDAVSISASSNIVFQGNTIDSPGLDGINAQRDVVGNIILNSNTITGVKPEHAEISNSSENFQFFAPTQATGFSNMSGVQTETCSEGGQDVTGITNGTYTVYSDVKLDGVTDFIARVGSADNGGTIEIRLDSATGTLIGTCTVPGTGGAQTFADASCAINGASGTHDVYLVFSGSFNLAWFAWPQGFNAINAATYSGTSGGTSGVQTEDCCEGGQNLSDLHDGAYTVYNNIDLTNAAIFAARVSSKEHKGSIQVHLDDPNGALIGTCSISNTDGLQAWVTKVCKITPIGGTHNICLVFSGGGFNVEWFAFRAAFSKAIPSSSPPSP